MRCLPPSDSPAVSSPPPRVAAAFQTPRAAAFEHLSAATAALIAANRIAAIYPEDTPANARRIETALAVVERHVVEARTLLLRRGGRADA